MSLMKLILDTMRDPDVRRRARARPQAAAKHYGLSAETVRGYLGLMR